MIKSGGPTSNKELQSGKEKNLRGSNYKKKVLIFPELNNTSLQIKKDPRNLSMSKGEKKIRHITVKVQNLGDNTKVL